MTANPANSSGANGHASDGNAGIGAPIDDEVTRIDAVRHHAGVIGHGALTLAFLVAAVVLVSRGMVGSGVLTLGIAYGVALNGVTAHAWDRLRAYFASVLGDGEGDSTPVRVPRGVSTRVDLLAASRGDAVDTRRPGSRLLSTELAVELLATTVLVGGLLATLGVAIAVLRLVGVEVAVYLFAAALLAGIVGVVGRAYYGR